VKDYLRGLVPKVSGVGVGECHRTKGRVLGANLNCSESCLGILDTPKVVISISGPSKSGKTVVVEKVVGKDNLIPTSGAEVRIGDDLWSSWWAIYETRPSQYRSMS
jgi:hypothetical protein